MTFQNSPQYTVAETRPITRWLWPTICGALLLVIVVFATRRNSDQGVLFVIPDGFRGVIKIQESPNAPQIAVVNKEYVYRVPSNGALLVPTTASLEHLSDVRATFANGTALPVRQTPLAEPYDDDLALHVVTIDSDGTLYLLIGSERELERLYKTRDFTLGAVHISSP